MEKSLSDSKAQDVTVINLKGKSDIADFMYVATGTSSRHVISIADNLTMKMKEYGVKGIEPEGKDTAEWVLVDLIDIIVHVFQPEIRSKYEIEKMWQVPSESKEKRAAKPKAKKEETKEKKKTVVKTKKPAKKAAAKKPTSKTKK